ILIYEKNIEKLRSLLSDKTIINLYFDPIMCSLKDLSEIGAKDVVEKINEIIQDSVNNDPNMYTKIRKMGYIALNYFVEKEYIKANNCFDLQTNLLLKNISKQTTINYFKLYNICKNNKIKLIAMQYPVRSIKPLKEILKDCEGVTFISNEEKFKQALKTYKIEDIFNDRFAGDFGHCTDLGNTLIAENVAETILNLYN
ncbi:MAG: hypothetical protein K5622_01860, partial [Endomicrobiaceae bacterium]|nr:hypothetical protein [Endomicrobiaceae bacterium]